MRKLVWSFALLSIAACASKQTSTDLGPSTVTSSAVVQNPAVSGGTGATLSLVNVASASKTEVPMPVDNAWAALDKAYAALGLKPTAVANASRMLAAENFKVRRKLGDIQLRTALDCGGESSSPNSETYEITLTVRSTVAAAGPSASVLQTIIEGVGRNALTNNSNQVPCYSAGAIEKRIAELVKSGGSAGGTTVVPKKGGD